MSKGGDLFLESIYQQAKFLLKKYDGNQQYASHSHYCNLIEHYIAKSPYCAKPKRAPISDTMRKSKLVQMIYEYFEEENILANQKIERNKILINTISEKGFSFGVIPQKVQIVNLV